MLSQLQIVVMVDQKQTIDKNFLDLVLWKQLLNVQTYRTFNNDGSFDHLK